VVLPAARPAIAVTALFAFMSAYNEFILAATLLGKEYVAGTSALARRRGAARRELTGL